MPAPKDNLPYKLRAKIPVPQLRSHNEWPLWKEYIEKTAKLCGVWEYCDPAIPKGEDLDLQVKLSAPSFKTVRKDSRKIADLDDTDLQKLRSLVKEYEENKDKLLRKKKAVDAIGDLIYESVSEPYIKHAQQATPYLQLKALSEAFSGPSPNDINELSSEWLALQQLADSPEIQQYITRWKALFQKCLDLDLANGSREQALGNSLLDTQDPATSWKPLQFKSWFDIWGRLGFDTEDTYGWVPGPESDTEGDDKSQNEDGRSIGSWPTEAALHSDDEGEGDDGGVITW